jgi:hypothetical protein
MFLIQNKILYALVCIAFIVLPWHRPSSAEIGKVFFDQKVTIVPMLDSCQVDIDVDSNLTGIHCFRVKVDFDRSLIQLDSVVEGSLLNEHGETFFYYKDTAGIYDIFNCIIDPTNGFANGPGVLATMQFVAGNHPGITPLTFTYVLFQDTLLELIYWSYSNAWVIVCGPETYRFGDANKDGEINVSDVIYLINYLFIDGPEPVPLWIVGDVNCDIKVDVSDVVYLINYLFINGPEPCNPCE